MKKQVLSIKQLEHLLSIGSNVSPDSHGLNYCAKDDKIILTIGIDGFPVCKALTVHDLIERLPKTIDGYSLRILPTVKFYIVEYSAIIDGALLHNGLHEYSEDLLEAVYEMYVTLIEKHLIIS